MSQEQSKNNITRNFYYSATIQHEEIKLVPTQNLNPYVLVSLTQDGTLQATKEKQILTQAQNL